MNQRTQTFTHTVITASICTTCLLPLLAFTPMAFAQETNAPAVQIAPAPASIANDEAAPAELTAVPPRLEITAKPGSTIQKTIKVKNPTRFTQYVDTSIEDFIVDTDGKTPIPAGESISNRFSLASWVTASPTRFSIGPNQTQVLDIIIQVPANAAPGGRYAMVLHGQTQDKGALKGESSTGVSSKVGTLVYLTVEGDIHEEAFIRKLTAPSLVEFGPVPFNFEIENRSDVHIRPQISVQIFDMVGRKINTIKVEEKNIFPYTSRDFSTSLEQYWGFGQYTARVMAAYGTQGTVTQAIVKFWIIPYKLIGAILIALLSAISIGIAVRRHLLHRSDSKTQEIELLKQRVHELEETKQP